MYLEKEMVVNTILKMDEFKLRLENLYDDYSIDINENTGRRNALISGVQEKVLADELSKTFSDVVSDGAPGMPDIVIGEIETELECKLTSGSGKKSRSYSLQTDYATICNKGELDYVYFVTNEDMTGYCVVYFAGLTPDDFYVPPESARGKARMNKKLGMKKAIPIVGNVKNLNEEHIERYQSEIKRVEELKDETIKSYLYDVESYLHKSKMNRLIVNLEKEKHRIDKKIEKLKKKSDMWSDKDPCFSFVFEDIELLKGEKEDDRD